jgi:type II secretory pathway pseudopilin PulG
MGMMRDGWWGPARTDAGLGLVEVVIAMLLLMVLSLAVLPLMITATQSSVGNREMVKANAFANSTVAALRAQFPDQSTETSCGSVRAATGEADAETGLTSTVTFPGGCPAQYPGTVTVTVSVARTAAPGTPLTAVSTQLLVGRA